MLFVVANDKRTHEFFFLDVISEIFVPLALDVGFFEFLLDAVELDIFEVLVNDIDCFGQAFLSPVAFFEFLDDLPEALNSVGCVFLDLDDFGLEKAVVFLEELLDLLPFLGVDYQGHCKVVKTLLENGLEV